VEIGPPGRRLDSVADARRPYWHRRAGALTGGGNSSVVAFVCVYA